MRPRRIMVAAVCGIALLLTGCNTGNGVVTLASTKANVRYVNLIPNASGAIDVTFNGNTVVSGLDFEALTPYQQINASTVDTGSYTVQAFVEGAPSYLLNSSIIALGETNYSYIMFGPVDSPMVQLFDETVTDPGAGNFNLRVINAAAGFAAVDVYLTPPGTDLNLVAPSVAGVGYGSVSGFGTLPFGSLELRVTAAGSKDPIYDSLPQNYAERGQVEVVVYSRESSVLVNVALLNIDSTGTGSFINSLLARFKVVNGSLVSSPLNVFLNGNLLLSNIPFTSSTGYQKTTATMPTLTVEATATPGATLLTIKPALTPATDSSIVLEGPAGALTAAVLTDNNLPVVANKAQVRVVNASADVPALDVFVNFSKQIAGLPLNSGAYSLALAADPLAGTSYQISFNVAGTTQTLLTLPAVALLGGGSYTIYAVGSSTALAAAITQDH